MSCFLTVNWWVRETFSGGSASLWFFSVSLIYVVSLENKWAEVCFVCTGYRAVSLGAGQQGGKSFIQTRGLVGGQG